MRLVGERLGLQLVGELTELVEVDARPEAERMRNRLRRRATALAGRLAQAGADRAIDRFFERNALLAGPLFQQARKVVVDRERRPHWSIMMQWILMSRHQIGTKLAVPASLHALPGLVATPDSRVMP